MTNGAHKRVLELHLQETGGGGNTVPDFRAEYMIPDKVQEHTRQEANIILGEQRNSPRAKRDAFRLATYGEKNPAHHQSLEQIFMMIERSEGNNDVIQKLLQEIIQATAETKSYEATAEKALECLFWMEKVGQHTEYEVYIQAVNIVKQFLSQALKIRSTLAHDYIMNWRAESFEPAKKKDGRANTGVIFHKPFNLEYYSG